MASVMFFRFWYTRGKILFDVLMPHVICGHFSQLVNCLCNVLNIIVGRFVQCLESRLHPIIKCK